MTHSTATPDGQAPPAAEMTPAQFANVKGDELSRESSSGSETTTPAAPIGDLLRDQIIAEDMLGASVAGYVLPTIGDADAVCRAGYRAAGAMADDRRLATVVDDCERWGWPVVLVGGADRIAPWLAAVSPGVTVRRMPVPTAYRDVADLLSGPCPDEAWLAAVITLLHGDADPVRPERREARYS